MKLEEKLIKLRKQNAWSQEELAEKLNVSRQTISKWELGQTTPDTDNLSKMATLFGISVNDLLDDNSDPVNNKTKNESKNNGIKIAILVIVLVLVLGGIGLIAINKIFNAVTNQIVPKSISEMFGENSISDIFKTIFGQIEKTHKEIEESSKKIEKDSFNAMFTTLYSGNLKGQLINPFIDAVIKSNAENPNNIITVIYKDIETSDSNELSVLKNNFNTKRDYPISYEYDENGYINKAIIGNEIITNFEISSFNSTFKNLFYGTTNASFMNNFIDEIIKSNEEHPDYIITVSFNGKETSNASELRTMKKSFSNDPRNSYDISYEYDENGFINKAKIEK